jgi:Na+/melibiose symporter-like transporter
MLLATALMQLYPLDEALMVKIEGDLKARRGEIESQTYALPAAEESR